MIRKLIAGVVLVLTLGFSLLSPASLQPAKAQMVVDCSHVRAHCRIYGDMIFYGCRERGGSWLLCYMEGEDAYRTCGSERGCNVTAPD